MCFESYTRIIVCISCALIFLFLRDKFSIPTIYYDGPHRYDSIYIKDNISVIQKYFELPLLTNSRAKPPKVRIKRVYNETVYITVFNETVYITTTDIISKEKRKYNHPAIASTTADKM